MSTQSECLPIKVAVYFDTDSRKEVEAIALVDLNTAKTILEKMFNSQETYNATRDLLATWGITYKEITKE